jgi:hypothetical protein
MEDWLAKHTITCPLGRLTTGQCAANRARPTVADHFKLNPGRHLGMKQAAAVVFRPSACEDCTQWQQENQLLEKEEDMATSEKKIAECAECREEKIIVGRGLCGKCYWRLPEIKEKKKLRDKARAEAKKPAASGAQLSDAHPAKPRKQPRADAGGGHSPEKAPAGAEHVLQIDFSGCPEVLVKICHLAGAQDRNPDQQARFLLRQAVGLACSFTTVGDGD